MPSGSTAMTSGASAESVARSASARSWAADRPQRGVRDRLGVDVGERRLRDGAVGAQDPATVGGGGVGRVAPALLPERRPLCPARCGSGRRRDPAPPRARRRPPAPRRRGAPRRSGTTTSRPRCRSSRTARRRASRSPGTLRARGHGTRGRSCPAPRACRDARASPAGRRAHPAWSARSRAGPAAAGARDQRVAAEQRVEAAGIALLDRRRGRVRPPLVGQQSVKVGDDLGHVVEERSRLPDLSAQLRRLQRRRDRRPAPGSSAGSTTSPRWASTCSGCRRCTRRRRTTTATTSATTRTSTRCSARWTTSTRCSPRCTSAA